jgi:hypothetical protein
MSRATPLLNPMILFLLTYLFGYNYLTAANCKFYGVWTE